MSVVTLYARPRGCAAKALLHQSIHGASGNPDAFAKELSPQLLDAVDATEALLVHAPDLDAKNLGALLAGRTPLWIEVASPLSRA